MTDRTIDDLVTEDGSVDIDELRSRLHDIEDFYVHGIDGGTIDNYESAWNQLRHDLKELSDIIEEQSQ